MYFLIVGSKGFIGKAIYNFLITKGCSVIGCDIQISNGEKNYFMINKNDPNYNQFFELYDISFCINCSGSANVQLSILEPFNDFILNTVNVFKILDAIRLKSPTTKLINLSSAAVYGNPIKLPIKEDFSLNPISPYGIHKMQAEQLCNQFNYFYGVKVCSVRIFSAYGVGLKKQLFWDLFNKIKEEDPIFLFGSGDETRDFIYIDDILLALYLIIENGSFESDIYNIASGRTITIKEVARLFFNQFDEKIKYEFIDEIKAGDPKYWQADISKISNLGFKQNISIELGIEKYVKWLKELN